MVANLNLYLSLKCEYILKTLDDSKSEDTEEGKEKYQRKYGLLNWAGNHISKYRQLQLRCFLL